MATSLRLWLEPKVLATSGTSRATGLMLSVLGALTAISCGFTWEPRVLSEVTSPTRAYVAMSFDMDVRGAAGSFEHLVGVTRRDDASFGAAFRVAELPWTTTLEWRGPEHLHVIVDCGEAPPCGTRQDRHWTVTATDRWADVRITYAFSEELRQALTPDDWKRIPGHLR